MQKHSQEEVIKPPIKFDLAAAARAALGNTMIRSYASMMALFIPPVTVFAIVVMPYTNDIDSASNQYLFLGAAIAALSSIVCVFFVLCAWVCARLPPRFSRFFFTLAAVGSGMLSGMHLLAILFHDGVSSAANMLETPWRIFLTIFFAEITILATIVAISPLHRLQVIRDLPWKFRQLFDHLVGVPPALSHAAKGRTGVRLRYLIGTLILTIFVAPLMRVQELTFTTDQQKLLYHICSLGNSAQYLECERDAEQFNAIVATSMLGMIVLISVVLFFCVSIARGVINSGKKRVLKYAAEAQTDEQRPTILFLRAFDHDQVTLPVRYKTPAQWLFSLRGIKTPLDHLLVEEFSDYGCINSLGKLDEDYPPFGAVRQYCHQADWRDSVIQRAKQAAAVVICIADDDIDRLGISAELDILEDETLRTKTLFVVRPRTANKKANLKAWSMAGLQPPNSDKRYLCSFIDQNGERRWGQAKAFNQMEYWVALKWFFYSRFGEINNNT